MRSLRLILVSLILWTGSALAAELPHSPGPGEVVSSVRPVITVQLPRKADLPYDSARMWVNGKEVSGLCLKTPMFVSYQSPLEMPDGPVAVRFKLAEYDLSWNFTITRKALIESITHDATENLGEYEELHVTLQGEPGGQAWFELVGVLDKVPMEETQAGVYTGSHLVQPGESRLGCKLVGHLRLGRRQDEKTADKPVNLFANFFRVQVIEPKSGTEVPTSFTIKGRTRPNCKITMVPAVGFNDNIDAPKSRNGDRPTGEGSIEGHSDANGFFEMNYSVLVALPNLRVVLTLFAIDAEGNRSAPTFLRYRF